MTNEELEKEYGLLLAFYFGKSVHDRDVQMRAPIDIFVFITALHQQTAEVERLQEAHNGG